MHISCYTYKLLYCTLYQVILVTIVFDIKIHVVTYRKLDTIQSYLVQYETKYTLYSSINKQSIIQYQIYCAMSNNMFTYSN